MIAVIDYGVGNLRSVEKAFAFIGYEACVTSDRTAICNADAVVLPGVGAYAGAVERLEKAGLFGILKDAVDSGRPFLGICLGMQMLFEYSEEGGRSAPGLGVFKGVIKLIPTRINEINLKVPHMGWNSLNIKRDSPLFRGLPCNPYVYFVHSYYPDARDRDIVIASAEYGIEFDAAINRGNVYATQFHPEKSGAVGLQMLRNWAGLIGR